MQVKVWKFRLPLTGYAVVSMPRHAQILHVEDQPGIGPCVWATVREDEPIVNRSFRIVGTGHPFDASEAVTPVGSIMLHAGKLVFHVFDLGEEVRS
jgi:hypothetical protein